MGKKSSNKFGPQQIPAAAPSAAGMARASVEQQVERFFRERFQGLSVL